MPGSSTRSPASTGWLYGPLPDLVLGCGLGSMFVMAALGIWGSALSAIIPGALLILVFALPHYGATLLRVYELPEDRHKYALFAVWCTLAIAVCFVIGLRSALVGSLILTIYLTWSPWHYTGQNYGIFLILLGRRGVPVDRLTKRLIYLSFVFSYVLAFLAIHGVERSANYAPVSYAGTVFRLIPLGLPALASTPLIYGAVIGYLGSLVGALVLLLRAGSLAQVAPALVVFGTQALWFSLPVLTRFFVGADAPPLFGAIYSAYGFLWIAAAHSVQYLWITTYYATSSGDRATPGLGAIRLRYLASTAFAGFAIWTVPVLIFAPGVLGSLPHESGLALLVAATVNLHHFVLDGVVWKLRDGRVAQVLLRRGTPAGAPPDSTPPRVPQRGVSWTSRAVWATGAMCIAIGLVALWEENVGFRRSLETGDTVRAKTAVDRLSLLGRDGPKRRTRLGRELASDGSYRAARIQFDKGLALHPTADGWRAMALLYEQSAEWVLAARAYQAAIELEPGNPTLHYKEGLCWLEAGDPERAIAGLEAAAAIAPEERLIQLSLRRARREAARGDSNDEFLRPGKVEATEPLPR